MAYEPSPFRDRASLHSIEFTSFGAGGFADENFAGGEEVTRARMETFLTGDTVDSTPTVTVRTDDTRPGGE